MLTKHDVIGYCGTGILSQYGAQKIDCPVLSMVTCPNNIKQWCGASKVMNVWYNADTHLR